MFGLHCMFRDVTDLGSICVEYFLMLIYPVPHKQSKTKQHLITKVDAKLGPTGTVSAFWGNGYCNNENERGLRL